MSEPSEDEETVSCTLSDGCVLSEEDVLLASWRSEITVDLDFPTVDFVSLVGGGCMF